MNNNVLRSKIGRFMERQYLVLRRVNSLQQRTNEELAPIITEYLANMKDLMDTHNSR